MLAVRLQGYKVDEIEFISKAENGTQIKLGQSYKYNVQYAKDQNVCRGQFEIEVHDNDKPDIFKIRVVTVGIFQYNPDERKETIHAESFKAIFPYVKSLITTITANSGIKPILIPEIDIDSQEIYRFDSHGN